MPLATTWRVLALCALAFYLPGSLQFSAPPSARHRVNPSVTSTRLSATKKKRPGDNIIAVNRLAYRNYELIDTLEAGVSLLGTEAKSIRMKGSMNIRDGYIKCSKYGQATLHNVHIAKFKNAGPYFQHEEMRVRTLLLHKYEARKLFQRSENPGMTVIPIKAYFNDAGKVKLQIALCRGKNARDKRATIQAREAKREENRIIKNFRI